jgi:hypothetical protein
MPATVVPSFEYYDTNGNGTLDMQELSILTRHEWDRNSDGILDDNEWQEGQQEWQIALTGSADNIPGSLLDLPDGPGPDYSHIFNLWDGNADGSVDKNEALAALHKIYAPSARPLPEGTAWESLID